MRVGAVSTVRTKESHRIVSVFGLGFYVSPLVGALVGVAADCSVPAWLCQTVQKKEQATCQLELATKELVIDSNGGVELASEVEIPASTDDSGFKHISLTLSIPCIVGLAKTTSDTSVSLVRLLTDEEKRMKANHLQRTGGL